MTTTMTPEQAKEKIQGKLSHYFGVSPDNASDEFFYKAVVLILRDMMRDTRADFMQRSSEQGKKQVYYLCMEFLMGRSLKNALYNLNLTDTMAQALDGFGVKLDRLFECEPDAGLGNGGLGRLAACFLDALATGGYPAMGYSIRYEYGIFRQKLVDGWQTELPDFWLPGGEVWLVPHPEHACTVEFDGQVKEWWDNDFHHVAVEGATQVKAVPYDMMTAGKDGKGVALLRLWKAESSDMNMELFNDGDYMRAMEKNAMAEVISKVLYPSDNHREGKSLRLRQQYFLVSASVQDIIKRHLSQYNTLDNLPDKVAIHTNDTHPVLAIPELMRILLDECGYGWDEAYDIVRRTVAYTNHTVMREALECWPVDLFRDRLPRIYQIVAEIDRRERARIWERTGDAGMVERTAVISDGVVRMANLAVLVCHSVNGVSRLHSEILRQSVFADFCALEPQKFRSVTNGIAHRRWLCQANPRLASYLGELIGDDFVKDASQLERLCEYRDNSEVLGSLRQIKQENKRRLAEFLEKQGYGAINPDSIFDVQIKRLHEYKRQHLNALHILGQYLSLKQDPNQPFVPKTYLFGAKAAPGYFLAKQIIQLICSIAALIDNDPAVRDKLKVVYVEDYRVTLAEMLCPAADISEQISLAGTEASGTGNMKLMLNGAVTLGTEDGANVEIHEAVGDDNIIIFGLREAEVSELRARGYDPKQFYHNNPLLAQAIDLIGRGIGGKQFGDVSRILTEHDTYMALADYDDYCRAQKKASQLYQQPEVFGRMSLVNIAKAGRFSADRAIEEYARDIWHITPVD